MASTSTSKSNSPLENALANVPTRYRSKIIDSYLELKKRYQEAYYDLAWDSSGLSAAKFCESVLRLLQYETNRTVTPFGKHIPNFPDECRKIIESPVTSAVESLRVIVPRSLVFIYTLRGKRGIGHVGGDVEANEIDAAVIVRICDWIICEMIRIYHSLSLEEAQGVVDSLVIKSIPDIWDVAGKKRVLRKDLNYKQKALLLLYAQPEDGILVEDLFEWIEYSLLAEFKRSILKKLHADKLIEYDSENQIVYISPLGISEVENSIL